MLALLTILLTEKVGLLSQISLKDGLDFVQSFGLVSGLIWSVKQYLSYRDFKRDTQRDVKEIKEREAETKSEIKEISTAIQNAMNTFSEKIGEFVLELQTLKMYNQFNEKMEEKKQP